MKTLELASISPFLPPRSSSPFSLELASSSPFSSFPPSFPHQYQHYRQSWLPKQLNGRSLLHFIDSQKRLAPFCKSRINNHTKASSKSFHKLFGERRRLGHQEHFKSNTLIRLSPVGRGQSQKKQWQFLLSDPYRGSDLETAFWLFLEPLRSEFIGEL